MLLCTEWWCEWCCRPSAQVPGITCRGADCQGLPVPMPCLCTLLHRACPCLCCTPRRSLAGALWGGEALGLSMGHNCDLSSSQHTLLGSWAHTLSKETGRELEVGVMSAPHPRGVGFWQEVLCEGLRPQPHAELPFLTQPEAGSCGVRREQGSARPTQGQPTPGRPASQPESSKSAMTQGRTLVHAPLWALTCSSHPALHRPRQGWARKQQVPCGVRTGNRLALPLQHITES